MVEGTENPYGVEIMPTKPNTEKWERCVSDGQNGYNHAMPCGGDLAIDGDGWVQLPIGMGFDDTGFRIDACRYKAWSGFCMKCYVKGMFIIAGRKGKLVTKRPKLGKRKA